MLTSNLVELVKEGERISKTPCSGGVYRITCTATGKNYIGSTKRIFRHRWDGHLSHLKSSRHVNRHLQNAWNKYGEHFFDFCVLESVQFIKDLIDCEQKWLDFYQAFDREYGYNIAARADRSCPSEETKAKMRLSSSGRKMSEQTKEKLRAINLGRKHTPETRAKLCTARNKRTISDEAIAKMRLSLKGRKISADEIERMRQRQLGKRHTPETRAKMSATRKGKQLSEQDKINKSFAHRTYKLVAINPNGESYEVLNLHQFCQEHGLTRSNMQAVATGKIKQHKGWRLSRLEEGI